MRYIRHPHPRDITLSNGQKMEAKFAEMAIGHIDSCSHAFGKTKVALRMAVDLVAAIQRTPHGNIIEIEEAPYAVLKEIFENAEKYSVAMHVAMWRHVFDWIEAITDAPNSKDALSSTEAKAEPKALPPPPQKSGNGAAARR